MGITRYDDCEKSSLTWVKAENDVKS